MGQKANFNVKNKKIELLKKVGIAILVAIILYATIKAIDSVKTDLKNAKQTNNSELASYNTESGYNSLEELLSKYNAEFVRIEETRDFTKIYLKFKYDLFTDETSNESYFNNIAKSLAYFLNYRNFEMIDETKNIDIKIYCKKPNITEIVINDDPNYYLNQETNINRGKQNPEETRFTIQAPELQALIDGDWDESKVDWGTRESTCDKYQIYFDEGIKYKVVARKVYNVIFTEKYQGQVAGGLSTTASPQGVINALGEPTLVKDDNLYGYLSGYNYLFFDFSNKEISIYPVVKISERDEEELKTYIKELSDTSDVKKFATKLTGLWLDYNDYDYDSNFVDLKYTLKGVRLNISGNSIKNGLFIYQNYSGNRDIVDLDNVYMESEDFVVEAERERITDDYLNRRLEGELDEVDIQDVGNEFLVKFKSFSKDGNLGPIFYSITKEYADSELDRNIAVSSYKWYDDYNFVYSVNGDGIYVYNAVQMNVSKLAYINDDIIINSAGNGVIIYNNNQTIEINEN